MTNEELELVMLWNSQRQLAASSKDAEGETRRRIASEIFKGSRKATEPLTDGWSLSVEVPENYSVDKEKFYALIANSLPHEADEISKFISMVPEIKLGAFKKAPEHIQKLFSSVLTVKDGMPKLTLKPPKA